MLEGLAGIFWVTVEPATEGRREGRRDGGNEGTRDGGKEGRRDGGKEGGTLHEPPPAAPGKAE